MEHLLSERARGGGGSPIRELLLLTERPGMLSMAGGLPASDRFPDELLGAAFERAVRHAGVTGPVGWQYAPTAGVAMLREQIAGDEGVTVDDVVVTTGAQQGLDLLARALCDEGDVIVADDPTYVGALQAFRAAGADVVGTTSVTSFAEQLASGLRPKALYVVPNFHNPTGATTSAADRAALLELADRYGFLIIEDDPYGMLRFRGEPVDPIGGAGRPVVRLGTVSKTLAPGLRVGWMTGPAAVLGAVVRLKQSADLHTSSLNQLIVAEARSESVAYSAHIAELRDVYAERSAALQSALVDHLGDRVSFEAPAGGFFLWLRLHTGVAASEVLVAALAEGVAFVPGQAFATQPGRFADRARLSFATLDPSLLDEACRRLAAAFDACDSRTALVSHGA